MTHNTEGALEPKGMIIVHDLYLRGCEAAAAGRFTEALRKYETAFSADKSNSQLIGQLVSLLKVESTPAEATELLLRRNDESVPLPAPYDVGLRVQLGIALGRSGDLAGAERLLAAALSIDPDDRDANFYYAHALLMQGKPADRAQPFLDKAGKQQDDDVL